jgi:large subunit ribosomal protein L30e
MAPKKSKTDAHSIGSKLALVMKSGKVVLGYRSTLKSLRSSKAKLILVSASWFTRALPALHTNMLL